MPLLISPDEFKHIPWKNGLGSTLELAINAGGTLSNFDWRLSIATVSQDGVFSDFTGYIRNLVLISGKGITLTHDQTNVDSLTHVLDVARFNGGCVTQSTLTDGTIDDFNFMVNQYKYKLHVNTYVDEESVELNADNLTFIYCLSSSAVVTNLYGVDGTPPLTIPAKHLLKVEISPKQHYRVVGKMMIIGIIELI